MQGSARQKVRLARIWAKCEYLPICAHTTKPQQQSEFTRCLSKFHAANEPNISPEPCFPATAWPLSQLCPHTGYCHSVCTVIELDSTNSGLLFERQLSPMTNSFFFWKMMIFLPSYRTVQRIWLPANHWSRRACSKLASPSSGAAVIFFEANSAS
jgi:hypothetical protein